MKIRFVAVLALIFSAIFFSFTSNFQKAESADLVSLNSKCAISSFQNAYEGSQSVFVGEVTAEEKNGDTRIFDFKVEKYWKGASAKSLKISVYETARYQAWFKKGGKYLVYATADDDGNLRVGRCSRSREADSAKEDLQKLGKGKIPR